MDIPGGGVHVYGVLSVRASVCDCVCACATQFMCKRFEIIKGSLRVAASQYMGEALDLVRWMQISTAYPTPANNAPVEAVIRRLERWQLAPKE